MQALTGRATGSGNWQPASVLGAVQASGSCAQREAHPPAGGSRGVRAETVSESTRGAAGDSLFAQSDFARAHTLCARAGRSAPQPEGRGARLTPPVPEENLARARFRFEDAFSPDVELGPPAAPDAETLRAQSKFASTEFLSPLSEYRNFARFASRATRELFIERLLFENAGQTTLTPAAQILPIPEIVAILREAYQSQLPEPPPDQMPEQLPAASCQIFLPRGGYG